MTVEVEGAAAHEQRPGGGQAAAGAELQLAGEDIRAAGVAAGAGEGQRAQARLAQAARAGDGAGEAGVAGLVQDEVAIAQGDAAAGAGKRAHGLAVAILDIEDAAIDDERGGPAQPAAAAEGSVPALTVVSPS